MNDRVGLSLYKTVTDYDPSITEQEVYILQSIYLEAQQEKNRQTRILQLFLKLAFVFTPSMRHPSLRLAACLDQWMVVREASRPRQVPLGSSRSNEGAISHSGRTQ